MKLLVTGITALLTVSLLNPAQAVCPGNGGNNETSENFAAAGGNWAVSAATAGTVAGGLSSPDLLLTELAFTNNNQEFVEIYNPTASPINLDQYYLSDDQFATGPVGYWRITTAGYTIGTTSDFNVKFPPGSTIQPGEVIVIYMGAATSGTPLFSPLPFGFGTPDYEICNNSPSVPDMVAIGNIPGGTTTPSSSWNGLVTNGGEMVMLYKWDGVCDIVCDVDYLGWGATVSASTRNDKTGLSVDGIDGDAIPTAYSADTAIGSQSTGQTHASGNSIQRVAVGTHAANGNGCTILIVPVQETTWGGIKSLYR